MHDSICLFSRIENLGLDLHNFGQLVIKLDCDWRNNSSLKKSDMKNPRNRGVWLQIATFTQYFQNKLNPDLNISFKSYINDIAL